MRVTNLTIQSFQGIDYIDLNILKKTPITFIAGKNASGKTSVRDAIRFALIGDSDRVALKKDYPDMVRKGANAKEAFVSITADGFTWKRNVASGQSDTDLPDYPMVMPYLMGHTRFSELPSREKMPILFSITGTSAKPAVVVKMLEEMGIAEQCTAGVTPILRLGFAKAHKHCKDEQTQARGAWKAITGETFGVKKAGSWKAPMIDYNIEELEDQVSALTSNTADAKEDYEAAAKAHTEATAEMNRRSKNAAAHARSERDTEVRAMVYTCPCCD